MDKTNEVNEASTAIVTIAADDQLVGGTYLMGKDGVRTLVEPSTADHPDGNGPRAAAGEATLAAAQSPATPLAAAQSPAGAGATATPAKSTKTALAVVKDAALSTAQLKGDDK